MYMINGNRKYLKMLMKIFDRDGVHYRETIFNDYIIIFRDPEECIPKELMSRFRIGEFQESHASIVKGSDYAKRIYMPWLEFKQGMVVKIVDGKYKGFSGIIKEVTKKNLKVEISIWGRIIEDTLNFDDVIPTIPTEVKEGGN